ncbi:DUF2845 domain-containing protein [Aquipseudomonas alcaligenes]|nr:DUF2845 domain-containing protein [Pseudomonas alcaligenes]
MYKLLLATLISLTSLTAHASLRCDNGIASEGDRTSEVLSKCGAPVSQAVTGYTYDDEGHREFQREEWVYGPKNGMYYFLQFEGERLKRVESKRH